MNSHLNNNTDRKQTGISNLIIVTIIIVLYQSTNGKDQSMVDEEREREREERERERERERKYKTSVRLMLLY